MAIRNNQYDGNKLMISEITNIMGQSKYQISYDKLNKLSIETDMIHLDNKPCYISHHGKNKIVFFHKQDETLHALIRTIVDDIKKQVKAICPNVDKFKEPINDAVWITLQKYTDICSTKITCDNYNGTTTLIHEKNNKYTYNMLNKIIEHNGNIECKYFLCFNMYIYSSTCCIELEAKSIDIKIVSKNKNFHL